MSSDYLRHAQRVVVKIGSALLIGPDGKLREAWLAALAEDIATLRASGKQVLIVSSGAIALGAEALGLATPRARLEDAQAAAAVGQIRLAHAWQDALGRHSFDVAQVLLTFTDTEERRRYLNARSTLTNLLERGVIPVVNENDTVTTSEIRYGDNDRLAARVAVMVSADALLLLSDVDGLYTADPATSADAQFVPEVHHLTPEIEAMAGQAVRQGVGSGGMITKLAAAKIAMRGGCHMAILSGQQMHPIAAYSKDKHASWFIAEADPISARKQWIAGHLQPTGTLQIDAGAVAALLAGKSLLPAGVTQVVGDFERGDAVMLQGPEGRELARGLVAYSSADAARIAGHQTSEIADILGHQERGELVHRDNMVLL